MKFGWADLSDVFSSGPGLVLRQLVLFVLAVWLGCSLAASSLVAGEIARAFDRFEIDDFLILLYSPVLLLNLWLPLNLLFLPIMLWRVVACSDSIGYKTWGFLIGGEALFAMAGADYKGWPLGLAWCCCLFMIVTACAALWYGHQWLMRRWANQLMAIEIENAERRREMKEEFGTESAGFKESNLP